MGTPPAFIGQAPCARFLKLREHVVPRFAGVQGTAATVTRPVRHVNEVDAVAAVIHMQPVAQMPAIAVQGQRLE
jgi:hypothetical protein